MESKAVCFFFRGSFGILNHTHTEQWWRCKSWGWKQNVDPSQHQRSLTLNGGWVDGILFCWFKVIVFHTVYHGKSPSNHQFGRQFLVSLFPKSHRRSNKIQVLDVEFPSMILGDVNSQFYPCCLTLPYYTNTRVIKQQLRSPTFRDHPNKAGSVEIHCWGDPAGIYTQYRWCGDDVAGNMLRILSERNYLPYLRWFQVGLMILWDC